MYDRLNDIVTEDKGEVSTGVISRDLSRGLGFTIKKGFHDFTPKFLVQWTSKRNIIDIFLL